MDEINSLQTTSEPLLVPKNEPIDPDLVKTENIDEPFVEIGILSPSKENEFSIKKELIEPKISFETSLESVLPKVKNSFLLTKAFKC